jgi:capsular exopolysaccharide synthesis family protein
MSYIFEALQRAEAERTGAAAPARAESVAELLQELEPGERKVERAEPIPPLPASAWEAETSAAGMFAGSKPLTPAPVAESRLVCLTDQGSLAAEQFRVLGLKLRNLRERRKLRRIVVTGTAPQEGKSLVAVNLALNQARSKVLKTLLVDGDLRRPTLAERFGFERSLPGLSECLGGERDLGDAVYKISGTGLWFMPAGRPPENPLELMQAGRVPELLDRLGKFFDWIIIDTPPVTPVADTTFWIKQADGVLMVIREGVSEKKIIEKTMNALDGSALLGVVVNSCSSSERKDYYARYGQGPAQAGGTSPKGPEVSERQAE